MEKIIKCLRFGKEEIRKAGKPRGKQQYQSKVCKRKFITEINYKKELKEKGIKIFYEGNSGRAVGPIMGTNKSMIYNWIKKMNEKIEGFNVAYDRTENRIQKTVDKAKKAK